MRDIKTATEFKEEGNQFAFMFCFTDRLYKKGDFAAAIQSYKMSIRHCPLDDEYNKDRVCLRSVKFPLGCVFRKYGCLPD